MGKFAKAEIEQAVSHYTTVVEGCSASGDWRPFADLFTEDVVYTEHHYGVFHGREAVREWIVSVMAPFPHMRFPSDWTAYDEANDAVVIMIKNLLDHPTVSSSLHQVVKQHDAQPPAPGHDKSLTTSNSLPRSSQSPSEVS